MKNIENNIMFAEANKEKLRTFKFSLAENN